MKSAIAATVLSQLDEPEMVELAMANDTIVKVLTLIGDKADEELLQIARDTNMGQQELITNAREREALDYLSRNVFEVRNCIIKERQKMRTTAAHLSVETNLHHARK